MATTAKTRITPKPKQQSNGGSVLNLPAPIVKVAPVVRVAAPQIDVKIAAPQVTVDAKAFTAAINDMSRQFSDALGTIAAAMAIHDRRLVDVSAEQQKLLKKIADNNTPAVLSARPDSFDVLFVEDDDGKRVGMRIRANKD
jgi:ABC-type transporter Mla subunit MlaD